MTFNNIKKQHYVYWIGILLSVFLAIFTRFSGLTKFPPSLYWEEAALGYDAYSILKTGKDVHGHVMPLVAFESFGDFKPSFYFYTLVPSIAVFGLTDFAVRFPSALSGVLLVVGIGLIAHEIERSLKRRAELLPVLSMLIASLSPWAIGFSRGGWEVNVATTLLTFGIWLQLIVRRKLLSMTDKVSKILISQLIISVILIGLSMYTYHATRVVAPLLLLGLWLDVLYELWLKRKLFKITWLIGAGILFTIFISPILFSLHSVQTQQRFAETSLFADGRQVKRSNELISQSNPHWLGKIIYHRYLISAEMILENYLSHFTFTFLFLNGDSNPRHSTQFVGLMYTGEVVLLLAGCYFLFSKRQPLIFFLFFWLLVGVIPASLTTATPHALRILPSMPAWIFILSCGSIQMIVWLEVIINPILALTKVKNKKSISSYAILVMFVLFYGWQFSSYWKFYSTVYPKLYESEWQYGYQEMVEDVAAAQRQNPSLPVEISRELGRPSMYYWFYTKTDPLLVQAEEKTVKKDQGEFLQYKNILFVDDVTVSQETIVASSFETYKKVEAQSHSLKVLNTVKNLQNKVVWVIYLAK